MVLPSRGAPEASRVLGIDLQNDLAVCREVRDYLGLGTVEFQNMRLHQVHSAWGSVGPSTSRSQPLHYLYFGSHRESEHYGVTPRSSRT